jgi:hypothetical protein
MIWDLDSREDFEVQRIIQDFIRRIVFELGPPGTTPAITNPWQVMVKFSICQKLNNSKPHL